MKQEIAADAMQGYVKFQISEEENLKLRYHSPIRGQFNTDHNEMLRVPNAHKNEQHIPVLELLV